MTLVKPVTKKLLDVFLDIQTFPTGFEPDCWLRLQYREGRWVQVGGIRIPSWQFKKLTGAL